MRNYVDALKYPCPIIKVDLLIVNLKKHYMKFTVYMPHALGNISARNNLKYNHIILKNNLKIYYE